MSQLDDVLKRLQEVMKHITTVDPNYLYPFGDPGPPASTLDIHRLEAHIGRKLPVSLRKLLMRHNGWPEFYHHVHLLSTHEMIDSQLMADARETLQYCMDEVGPTYQGVSLKAAIVFGVRRGEDLFLFNPLKPRGRDDMEVVWWHNGVVDRQNSLADFLGGIHELLLSHLRRTSGQGEDRP